MLKKDATSKNERGVATSFLYKALNQKEEEIVTL